MGAVKQQMMEDAENILNVLAHKLVGGDITEDDALEILSKQMDNLEITVSVLAINLAQVEIMIQIILNKWL